MPSRLGEIPSPAKIQPDNRLGGSDGSMADVRLLGGLSGTSLRSDYGVRTIELANKSDTCKPCIPGTNGCSVSCNSKNPNKPCPSR